MTTTVLVAGGTGDLGRRIIAELLLEDTRIRVLTRPGSARPQSQPNASDRVDIVEADYADPRALEAALTGVTVVVSAVSGTREVIVDAQRLLLAAAVNAGVERFIPSDYSADYRRITPGSNRNFELRREFAGDVDAAAIRGTSVLNGAFTDLLTGDAPIILYKRHRVLYWSSPDQILDFTTKDDTARMTALVALDPQAPRVVEVAGDRVTARDLAATMTRLTGTRFVLQWAGTTRGLSAVAKVARKVAPATDAAFPAWQGMQYLVSMFSGQAELRHVANDRYGLHSWTTAEHVISEHIAPGLGATQR